MITKCKRTISYSNQFIECVEELEQILTLRMSRFWTKEMKHSNKSTLIYQSQHSEWKFSRLDLIYIAMIIFFWSLKTQHSKTMNSHQKILKSGLGNATQTLITNIRSLWMEVVQKSKKDLMWQMYISRYTFYVNYCTMCKISLPRSIIFTNYRLQYHSSVSFEVIFSNRYLEDIFIFTYNGSILHLFK